MVSSTSIPARSPSRSGINGRRSEASSTHAYCRVAARPGQRDHIFGAPWPPLGRGHAARAQVRVPARRRRVPLGTPAEADPAGEPRPGAGAGRRAATTGRTLEAMGLLAIAAVVLVVAAMFVLLLQGGEKGSCIRVAVDDLAVGHLPSICVKTGQAADLSVAVESSEQGFQPWWILLLLLGPVGIVAIVLLWTFGRRANRVGGQVPLSSAALQRYNDAVQMARMAMALAFAGVIFGTGALALAPGPAEIRAFGVVGVLAIVAGICGTLTASYAAKRRWIDVELDGSGRWAVLTNVHPSFVAAVRGHYQATRQSVD